jgi:CHASE2 domain-containing sensor protein
VNPTDDVMKNVLNDPSGMKSMLGSFSLSWIIVAGLFGIIGMAYFMYGKKSLRYVFLICGIVLMVYPYFVTRTLYMVIVGVVVSAVPFVVKI